MRASGALASLMRAKAHPASREIKQERRSA